ncbi:MAG TPA: DbpA RNA binding domain-containing protein [Flavipsychrobacter sp.]|nr:DbpA RNA binding domain-containing protein [Flavipsychrobacter sp.]
MNVGSKDGIESNDKLVKFVAEATDLEPGMIFRVTVRELSSFFNVRGDAAEFIKETLSQKKFKGRKIRIEEAEQRSNDQGRDRAKSYGERRSGDFKPRYGKSDSQKINKRH